MVRSNAGAGLGSLAPAQGHPPGWNLSNVATPWCDHRLLHPGLDVVAKCRLRALTADWVAQALAFDLHRPDRRRQRILTTATRPVPEANLDAALAATMLDWCFLFEANAELDGLLPAGWADAAERVWLGSFVADWTRIPQAARALGRLGRRRRFIWLTALRADPDELDLHEVDWLVVGHPDEPICAAHLTALKVQAMGWGVPVWCAGSTEWRECPPSR